MQVLKGQASIPDSRLVQPEVTDDGGFFVTLDDYTWEAPRDKNAIVLEHGPGLGGARFVDAQLRVLSHGNLPFQYIGISDGPFVNRFLNTYFGEKVKNLFHQSLARAVLNGATFAGREDGMLQATEELLATPQPSGTQQVCDLILMSALHHARPNELEFAIKNSPQLLRPEGRLLIASPLKKVDQRVTTFSKQIEWATEAGYEVEWQNTRTTGQPLIGGTTKSGLAALKHKNN